MPVLVPDHKEKCLAFTCSLEHRLHCFASYLRGTLQIYHDANNSASQGCIKKRSFSLTIIQKGPGSSSFLERAVKQKTLFNPHFLRLKISDTL